MLLIILSVLLLLPGSFQTGANAVVMSNLMPNMTLTLISINSDGICGFGYGDISANASYTQAPYLCADEMRCQAQFPPTAGMVYSWTCPWTNIVEYFMISVQWPCGGLPSYNFTLTGGTCGCFDVSGFNGSTVLTSSTYQFTLLDFSWEYSIEWMQVTIHPLDRLLSNQFGNLYMNDQLLSSNGSFTLIQQTNGYCDEYYAGQVASFYQFAYTSEGNVDSSGNYPNRLAMQSDGNLVGYTGYTGISGVLFSTNTHGVGIGPYTLLLQNNGLLVLLTSTGSQSWSSGTSI